MELSIKYGWSIVYIEGSPVIISKIIVFLSLKINAILANSAGPDEMPHHAAFHLDPRCLPKYGRCTSIRGSSRNRDMTEKKPPLINP